MPEPSRIRPGAGRTRRRNGDVSPTWGGRVTGTAAGCCSAASTSARASIAGGSSYSVGFASWRYPVATPPTTMASPSQPSGDSRWLNRISASSVPPTGHALDDARQRDGGGARSVAPALDRERRPRHHDEGEQHPQRGEPLAQERLGENRDEDGRDVEQCCGSGDAGSGDPELVRHLEQGDERAAAEPHQQPGSPIDPEQPRPEPAVHQEAGETERETPEPDPRDGLAGPVQGGRERARGAPHGAGREGEQITGEAAGARGQTRSPAWSAARMA